jgi:hypothetical protein
MLWFTLVTSSTLKKVKTQLWSFCRDRPKDGVDIHPPDGHAMMNEIIQMRKSLRHSVIHQFDESAKLMAKQEPLFMSNGASPVTTKDLKGALSTLKDSTRENHLLVYRICHEFHRDRNWMSNAIDNWLIQENMYLNPIKKTSTTKYYGTDRGGFGVIGRNAKAQALAKYMRRMVKHAKWYLATTDNSKKCSTAVYKQYNCTNARNNSKLTYYVVTKVIGANSTANNNVCDNFHLGSLNYNGIVTMLLEHGVLVDETTMKSIIRSNVVSEVIETAALNSLHDNLVVTDNHATGLTVTRIAGSFPTTLSNSARNDPGTYSQLFGEDCTRSGVSVVVERYEDTDDLHDDDLEDFDWHGASVSANGDNLRQLGYQPVNDVTTAVTLVSTNTITAGRFHEPSPFWSFPLTCLWQLSFCQQLRDAVTPTPSDPVADEDVSLHYIR